jgi:hypothetical protein
MAAAQVLYKVYNYDHTPGQETVVLTATDGETYTSKKFKTILGAHVTSNYNADAHINATFSGQTATINWAGQTDKTCTLTLYGKK